jgi:glycosyltransferase involved in cell wall biosynthesis
LSPEPSGGSGLIFVGGFRHRPNVDAMLFFCREVLPTILKTVPDARLSIVGSNPPPEIVSLSTDRVLVTGFVPSTTPHLHASRVSVAPLRFGAGMKGKIGEAMAHGVPVVTTTVGAQGMGLQHGMNALIADGPLAFADAVVQVLGDGQLHGRLRRNGAEHVARHFAPAHVASRLSALLADLEHLPVRRLSFSEKARFLAAWGHARIGRVFRS